jgi:Outer membrane protein beta-barrel domain
MRSVYRIPGRHVTILILAMGGLLASTAPVCAQGFGIGGRLAWVTRGVDADVDANVDADVDTLRFVGGQVRLLSQRFGVEVSMDRRSESFELLNQKVTETPIQTSLLLRLAGGRVTPFLLGGPGWYRRKVEAIDGGPGDLSVSTTEFGWHAGGGLEILPSRHIGIHGDYRYTFLDFGNDDDDDDGEGLVGRLLPGHRGSMWTIGATVYF